MSQDGYVEVGIEPNADGAAGEFRRELNQLEKQLPPVKVRVEPELTAAAVTAVRREINTKIASITPTVRVGLSVAPKALTELRRDITTGLAKITPTVRVGFDVRPATLRRDLNAAVKAVNTAGTAAKVRVEAEFRPAQIRTAANLAIREATPTVKPMVIPVTVRATDVRREANAAIVEATPLVRSLVISPEMRSRELVTKANAAIREARPMIPSLGVTWDADTTELARKATAAVLSVEAAIPTIDVSMGISQTSSATMAAQSSAMASAGGAGAGALGGKFLAGGAALVPGAALTGLFASSTGDAINLAEALTKVNTVFEGGAPLVEAWAKNAEYALGQSQSQALEAAGTYGNLMQAFGLARPEATKMSIELASLASDLASFNNTSVDDALVAIQSGLSGETEPLKRFGVALSDVRLKEQAMSMGLIKSTKEALDPAAKAQAAYGLIMKDTALAQGDFARNADGAANQQKILTAQWLNLKAVMGAPFAVALQEFLPIIQETLAELTPEIKMVSEVVARSLGDLVRELLPLAGPFIRSFTLLFGVFLDVMTQLAKAALPILIPLLNKASEAFAWMADNSERVTPVLTGIVGVFTALLAKKAVVGIIGGFVNVLGSLWSSLTGVWGTITKILPILSGLGASTFIPLAAALGVIGFTLYKAYQQSEPFREAIQGIVGLLRDQLWPAVQAIGGAISAVFGGDMDKARGKLSEAWGFIQGFVSQVRPLLAQAAGALWDWLGDVVPPIIDALGNALRAAGEWLIGTGLPWLGRTLGAGASFLWEWIQDSLPKVIDFIGDVWTAAIRWFVGTAIPKAVPLILKAFVGIVRFLITDGLPALFAVGRWLLTDLLPFLIRTLGQIIYQAARIFGTFYAEVIPLLWSGVQAIGAWLRDTALPWIGGALAGLGEWIGGAFGAAIDWVQENLPIWFARVGEWFGGLPETIGGWLGNLGDTLGGWVQNAFQWVADNAPSWARTALDWFGTLPGQILTAVGDLGGTLLQAGQDLMGGLWEGITTAATATGSFASDIVNSIITFINDNLIGVMNAGIDRVWPGIFGAAPQIPLIPAFAEGGLVKRPTFALVGEAGPELILPLGDMARVHELLAEAGLIQTAATGLTSAAGSVAAASMPSGVGISGWADETVETILSVPQRLISEVLPEQERWVNLTALSLTSAGERWVTIIGSAGARMVSSMLSTGQAMVAAARSIGDQTASALSGSITAGVPAVVGAVQTYARNLATTLNPILSAIGSTPVALQFARGGWVPGPDVRRDVVPAMLMPREVVIRRNSVEKFGKRSMLDLNEGRVPVGWQIPGFATGGEVTQEGVRRGRATAEAAVGKPYVWGAVGPDGFDCSGLWSAIINSVRGQAPNRRLFTSSSIIANASEIGMLPGLGQISIGAFAGNPGHVGGTIAGVNYEATPPRVRKGPTARGANDPIFTNRYHVGSGYWLDPGQSITLPSIPRVGMGELGRLASAFMGYTGRAAQGFVNDNTFTTDMSLADLIESNAAGSTQQVMAWISSALGLTGKPASWASGLYTIAMRESGGNPRAINLSDSNARRGTPSKGLMQVIDPTFRAYHLPGYGDIWDPVDNVAAAIQYIAGRYGDISRVQQANPSMPPRGYANGGEVVPDPDWLIGALMSALERSPRHNYEKVSFEMPLPPLSDPVLLADLTKRRILQALKK